MAILHGLKAIAEYVGRSTRTIQRWHKAHNFPAEKIGDNYLTSTTLIDQWLAGGRGPVKISPGTEEALDMVIMAGMEQYIEITDEGFRVKEGMTIPLNTVLKAIQLKISFIKRQTKDKEENDGNEDVWNIFEAQYSGVNR